MTGQRRDQVLLPDRVARPPTPLGVTAVVLGLATVLGHGFSYAFSLVLSRALGPADFGALGALLGLAVVATVPASALQTQVAMLAAVAPTRGAMSRGYRLSWIIGSVVAGVVALAALPLSSVLRLDSAVSVVLLAFGLLPVSVIAARQGVLLGKGAFAALALTTVLIPALRLVGGVVAAMSEAGVTGAIGFQALATWAGLAVVILVVRPLQGEPAPGGGGAHMRSQVRGLVAAGSSLLGLFVLANADVLLARIVLTDNDSGIYAVGALGARVVFWGSHFVALLVFPRVARGQGSGRFLLKAAAMVATVGLLGALASIPLAGPTLHVLVGPAYESAAAVAPWFVLLGTLLALVQLTTYVAVASERHRFSAALWATVGLQSIAIVLFANQILDIVLVYIAGTAMLALVSVVLLRGRRP